MEVCVIAEPVIDIYFLLLLLLTQAASRIAWELLEIEHALNGKRFFFFFFLVIFLGFNFLRVITDFLNPVSFMDISFRGCKKSLCYMINCLLTNRFSAHSFLCCISNKFKVN